MRVKKKRQCEKGKPCGATCIERKDKCLKDAGLDVAKSLTLARDSVQKPTVYKIAKSAEPQARPAQLHARRILTALGQEQNLIRTNGMLEEKDIKWGSVLGSGVRLVGSGDFGSFASIESYKLMSPKDAARFPPEVGVKVGKIGPNEVQALKIVGQEDLGPMLIAAKVSPIVKVTGRGKFESSNGVIAMTKVPGKPYIFAPNAVNGYSKSEMAWLAMAELHRLGIAHNDLHGKNIYISDGGVGTPPTARIIDYGLAQISAKAALAEALGVFSGSNFQFVVPKNNGHALTVKANLAYIEQLLRYDLGLSSSETSEIFKGGIRKKDDFYQKGAWGKLTEAQAQELIDNLYEGVY